MPPTVLRGRALTCAVLLTLLACLAGASGAHAGVFPITETFKNSTTGTEWQRSGSAVLTAPSDGEGNGWLRLTGAVNNQFGAIVNDNAFPSTNGILAEFEYATWGGTGADGLVFFLYDGATPYNEFHTGPAGGSIGYTNCAQTGLPGLKNAYIGVAFDEYGNFFNSTFCGQNGGVGGGALVPNRVGIRAGHTVNYQYLTSTTTTQSLIAQRAQSRKIKVAITPDMKLSVYITYPNGEIQTVASDFALPANAPSSLKMGFVAATGGSNNNHEIRSTQVVLPADLRTTVTDGATGGERGPRTWTATVTNDGPNPVTDATVKATSPQAGLSGISWTCAASGGARCDAASGAGLPDTTADLPVGATATYTITGTVADSADHAQLAVTAGHAAGSDTGESDPTNNSATDTTWLTPVWDGPTRPAFTLAANGTATMTGVGSPWRGGNLAYAPQWQRCAADGTGCSDIPGATAATYAVGAADKGGTIRLQVTGSNAAGVDVATSLPFSAIPDTAITSGPPALTSATSATVAFSQSGGPAGTSFECSLDGGAYTSCASPRALSGLGDGSHTLRVRATYGGLPDPTPAERTWRVDTTAPATSITSTQASPVNVATADVTFTGADETTATGDLTYECSLDGAAFADCTSDLALTGLAGGPHTFRVRAVDAAGNRDATPAEQTWTVDTAAPDTTIVSGPAALTNSTSATFDLGADEPATFECSRDGAAFSACEDPKTYTSLEHGDHTLEVRAVDAAGNVDPTPATHAWAVDTQVSAKVTAPAAGAWLNDSTPDVAMSGKDGDGWHLTVDGGTSGGGTLAADGAVTTLDPLADGTHTVDLTVRDDAGNEATDTVTFHVDTVKPAKPGMPVKPPVATNDNDPRFELTAEEHGTLLCKLDDGAWAACKSPLTFTDLADGKHTLRVKVRDRAGNESEPTTHTFTIDRDTTLAVTGPAPGNVGTPKPTVTATGEPGATVEVKIGGKVVATGTVGPDGTIALPLLEPLPDGEHTLTTTITDAAGNVRTSDIRLNVDTTAPGTPKVPAGPSPTSGTPTATFTLDGEPGATFKCRLDDGEWRACTPPVTFDGLPDGVHTLSIVAVDPTGNESPRQDYTWTVDTSKPAAPPVMDAPAVLSALGSARFEFSVEPGATLECSLDGATYAPCSAILQLTGLAAGKHTLLVRQVDAAGNAGEASRYEWEVDPAASASRKALPRKLSARIAARTTAADNRRVAVGCMLDRPSVAWCTVRAYRTTKAGKRVLVGTGKAKVAKAGKRSVVVGVRLNAAGRRALGRAIGGMGVRFTASAQGRGAKVLTAGTRTVLFPQRLLVLPTINPFVFDSTRMLSAAAGRELEAVAGKLRHARTITCVGHTDAAGSPAYNTALGLRRAKAVCAALRRLGVEARIRVASEGESQPRASNATSAGRLVNRRVELRVGY